MPTDKNTGAVKFSKSGSKATVEFIVPTGTKLKDALKVADAVRTGAIKKFQPGPCSTCISGRDFRIRELARVLPANFATNPVKNLAAVDLKTGKLIG